MRTLIIGGGGYIGLPLALARKASGDEVSVWVHSPASAATLQTHGFQRVIVGSVGDEEVWKKVQTEFDLAVHCASSGGGDEEAYREVFLRGATFMNERLNPARRVFVSSTSVYGQTNGEIVTEESAADPATATGRVLRETERACLSTGATVVRSAGIYGPGRSMLFEKFRRGEAVIEGDGDRWINQIHQRDLVAALLHLIDAETSDEIYNASDDMAVMQRDYYAWCAQFLNQPLPPTGPVNTRRKRGLTNKRVANAKLRASGWQPLYPSFREGLAADYSPR